MHYFQFINHASFFISNGKKGILTDPWYEGDVFHKGWNLLYENSNKDILEVINKTNFIWISHEHPDHFSIHFFKKYLDIIIKNNIKVIFQKTLDKRVINFLKKIDILTIELKDFEKYTIDEGFVISLFKNGFYDSAIIFEIGDKTIVNLNDCPINDLNVLKKIKNKINKCDILLTQFSYAAWKGGKDNINWRIESANQKIKTLILQSKILNASYTIPFASFVYFSNKLNHYLNKGINTPLKIIDNTKELNSKVIFFKPLEIQNLNNLEQNNESIEFWMNLYSKIDEYEYNTYNSVTIKDIQNSFVFYKQNIFKKNSFIVIYLLKLIPLLGAFKNIKIYFKDIQQSVSFDITGKLEMIDNQDIDIEMHSNSFNFLLKNTFGFDTLTVNGCFEEKKIGGFIKMSKCLSLGSLNNLGIYINFLFFLNVKIYLIFFKMIKQVSQKLSK